MEREVFTVLKNFDSRPRLRARKREVLGNLSTGLIAHQLNLFSIIVYTYSPVNTFFKGGVA
jgi:hypothetical protein